MTSQTKVEKLIFYLINSSADSFYCFAHALLLTGQFRIFSIIFDIIEFERYF